MKAAILEMVILIWTKDSNKIVLTWLNHHALWLRREGPPSLKQMMRTCKTSDWLLKWVHISKSIKINLVITLIHNLILTRKICQWAIMTHHLPSVSTLIDPNNPETSIPSLDNWKDLAIAELSEEYWESWRTRRDYLGVLRRFSFQRRRKDL